MGGADCGCGCGGAGCPVKYVRNRDGVWVALERRPSAWLPLPRRSYDPSLGGPPPADCGAGYTELVRAAGGRTEQFPSGQLIPGSGVPSLWCNQTDAEAWAAQAAAVFKLVRGAWNALIRAENKRKNWAESQSVRGSVTAYEEEYASLPEPSVWMAFGAGGCTKAVAAMIANIKNGACQLDLLNRSLQAIGAGTVPPPHGETGGGGGGIFALGGLTGAALVVGLLILVASRK